jgi:hypothetical protein
MCIKLVQSGHFDINDGYQYFSKAVMTNSLELISELLMCKPTEKTLLLGEPYDLAIKDG